MEEVNEGYYRFWTHTLQRLGVVNAEIRVRFDVSLVKLIAEKFGKYVRIVDRLGEYDVLQLDDEFRDIANEIDKAIRKAAIRKAAATGEAKRVYELTITADDVDFTEAERILEELES